MKYLSGKCPKCGAKMLNNCCVSCGYMSNGIYIGQYETVDKFGDLKLYNSSFDDMNINSNKFLIFILESLYFSYRNHIMFGFIIGLIDFFLSLFILREVGYFIGFNSSFLFIFCLIFYIIFKKLLYIMFANIICLKLDSLKIQKIKKKNNDYRKYLINHNDKSIIKLFLCILLYALILSIFILYKRIKNGTLWF